MNITAVSTLRHGKCEANIFRKWSTWYRGYALNLSRNLSALRLCLWDYSLDYSYHPISITHHHRKCSYDHSRLSDHVIFLFEFEYSQRMNCLACLNRITHSDSVSSLRLFVRHSSEKPDNLIALIYPIDDDGWRTRMDFVGLVNEFSQQYLDVIQLEY